MDMETETPSSAQAAPPFDFTFCVDQPACTLSPRSPQWDQPLPVVRPTKPALSPRSEEALPITYGDYFHSVKGFLTDQLWKILQALDARPQTVSGPVPRIDRVIIHLVKHGALYHPAKVTVRRNKQIDIHFVVNVATGETGRRMIHDEATQLKRLAQGPLGLMVPEVLAVGEGAAKGRPPMPMFAARWLDGFAEFHVSGHGADPRQWIWTVWDENGDWRLSPDQARRIYRQAAFILSCAYNPLTFEAILDWHHAAGDFIVRKAGTGIDVRLISVRRYAPLIQPRETENIGLNDILDGLILFLLDLTLRMRLDRLDGTGSMVWVADEGVVPATWQGFLRGLHHAVGFLELPSELVDGTIQYAAVHSEDDLVNLGGQVAARMTHLHEERDLIHRHLPQHAADLKKAVDHGADEGRLY